MIKRLSQKYKEEVVPEMMREFGYKSVMAIPKIEKVILNTSFGRLIGGKSKEEQKKIIDLMVRDLSLIAGLRPVLTKAKKSISGFKIRKGMPIGAMVTLRKKKMNDFLEKLIHINLPRTRDFRGLDPDSVDNNGNLTIGIKEDIVFPEVSDEGLIFGLEATIVSTAKSKKEGLRLFRLLGFPFKTDKSNKLSK